MAIYHIAYHGYRHAPSQEQFENQVAMFTAAFTAAPHIEEFFVGRYAGNPADGYHDAACVKFKDVDAYRVHMSSPHGPDEAAHLQENVARVRAFDVLTADEPAETAEKIIELYKMRWEMFPNVAKVLREDVDTHFPYL
jgi:hypothetical protein